MIYLMIVFLAYISTLIIINQGFVFFMIFVLFVLCLLLVWGITRKDQEQKFNETRIEDFEDTDVKFDRRAPR